MINFYIVLLIVVTHFLADFVFQSDRIAKDKAVDIDALMTHCMITFFCFSITISPIAIYYGNLLMVAFPYAILLFHFIQDYFTSKWCRKLSQEGRTHDFWVMIGLDQLLHIITYIGTFYVSTLL